MLVYLTFLSVLYTLGIAEPTDVKIIYYNRDIYYNPIRVTAGDILENFVPEIPTYLLIHGWLGNEDALLNTLMPPTILNKYNANVLILDYDFYAYTQFELDTVADYATQFLLGLQRKYGFSFDNLTIIGFSMGCHVSGLIGRRLNGQIKHIIALDPATKFFVFFKDFWLKKSDAKYVEIIHTSFAGAFTLWGHVDYMVNGGLIQPHCRRIECSHYRAVYLLVESFMNPLIGFLCNGKAEFDPQQCHLSYMGVYNEHPVEGFYQMRTHGIFPYGIDVYMPYA